MITLRRWVERVQGFALLIAVSNSPRASRDLIDVLAKRIPERRFTIVELDESTGSPLDDILHRLPPKVEGPVMVLGLERSCPSDAPFHPVLERLNLSRPRWPQELPHPVVLWLPEYLLGLLGREAPDFLDWRSDTLYFSELSGAELLAVDLDLWGGGTDGRFPEARRRSRIAELKDRLAKQSETEDPAVLAVRSSWLSELGNHLRLLGELEEAERMFLAALRIEEALGDIRGRARGYVQLAAILEARGQLQEAEGMLQKAILLYEELGDAKAAATSWGNLASIQMRLGLLTEAETSLERALSGHRALGDLEGIANDQAVLAGVYLQLGELQKAETILEEALRLYRRSGNLESTASALANSANIAFRQGDLNRAAQLFEEALALDEALGKKQGIAHQYRGLGAVYAEGGKLDQAEEMFTRSLDLDQEIGYRHGIAVSLENLGVLAERRGDPGKARAAWSGAHALYSAMGLAGEAARLQSWLGALPDSPTAGKRSVG